MNSLIASTEKPPRWPATEPSSLLSPSIRNVLFRVSCPDEEMPAPAVLVTPGVSCDNVAKLRPAIGSSSIVAVVIVVPSADRDVSTTGVSAVTVIASSSVPMRRAITTRASCATVSVMSDRTAVLNPDNSAVSS